MTSPAVQALRLQLQAALAMARDERSPNPRGSGTGLPDEREGHKGRRGDILADFHHKTGIYAGRDDDARRPLILKVTIAGSGCEVWMSHADADGKKQDKRLRRIDTPALNTADGTAPATYVNGKGDVTFSGPQNLGGTSDSGANSISNLVDTVNDVIAAAIPSEYANGDDVVVLIKSHSRGAVAASMIATRLKAARRNIRVELAQFDPVPGQFNYGERSEIAVGSHTTPERRRLVADPTAPIIDGQPTSLVEEVIPERQVVMAAGLDESTVVYSLASGYWYTLEFFQPQRVHGAKRIIVSRDGHSGGLVKGYMLDNVVFKGSRLNSLPRGAYYEVHKYSEGPHEGVVAIRKMYRDEFMDRVREMFVNARATARDLGREQIVTEVVQEFFTTNP